MFKRVFCLVLATLSIVILCSCNINESTSELITGHNIEPIETKESNTTNIESTIQTEGQTTNQIDPDVKNEEHYVASFYNIKNTRKFETQTRTLYLGIAFTYHNKFDDESYFLCFDPLCDHTSPSCTYSLFKNETGIYNKLDNRIYASRGDCLYSMGFNASDVKLEIKFSDFGSDITARLSRDTTQKSNLSIDIFGIYDEYIFFTRADVPEDIEFGQTYTKTFYRFNIKTKELVNLSNNADGVYPYALCISEYGKLYFRANVNDDIGFFSSDLDFKNFQRFDILPLETSAINTNKGMYFIGIDEYTQTERGNMPSKAHVGYLDFSNEQITKISESLSVYGHYNAPIKIFYFDDDYVIFSPYDAKELFKSKDYAGRETTESIIYHVLYKSTTDGKNTQVMLNGIMSSDPKDSAYDFMGVKIDGDNIIITAKVRKDAGEDTYKNTTLRAKITITLGEDGNYKILSIEEGNVNLRYD